jgi:hypothetical protein
MVFAAALPGCAGEDPSESPGLAAGAFGRVMFHVQPVSGPSEGENQFQLRLEEIASGMPIEGAVITVRPRMPAMGHSVTVEPRVVETGGGAYDVAGVIFSMPGAWQVYYRVEQNTLMDEALFSYDVR